MSVRLEVGPWQGGGLGGGRWTRHRILLIITFIFMPYSSLNLLLTTHFPQECASVCGNHSVPTAAGTAHTQTIRNRESAQRSRNQRKVHLVSLEERVIALEARNAVLEQENTLLRSTSTTSTTPSSPAPASSFALSPISATHVALADVAPPPNHLGIGLAPSTQFNRVAAPLEIDILRDRVTQLEAMLQAVIPLISITSVAPASALGLDTTLSPRIYPISDSATIQPISTPLARHPAVVATASSLDDASLQRARVSTLPPSLEKDETLRKVRVVARLVVGLARVRGWDEKSLAGRGLSRSMRSRRVWRR